jgi:FkbM family methyltransferase
MAAFGSLLERILRRLRGPVLQRPTVTVPKATLGTEYGSQTVCTLGLRAGAIAYSFGVGEDASFDLELIRSFGCEVYAFDPTPRSIAWVAASIRDPHFHFSPVGIAATDGSVQVGRPANPEHVSHYKPAHRATGAAALSTEFPVKRYETIRRELGHDRVDILKLDVEGFEFEVIPDLVRSPAPPGQLLVDFHHGMYGYTQRDAVRVVKAIYRAGFALFHVGQDGRHGSFVHRRLLGS